MLPIRKVKEKQGAIIVIQMINTLSDSTQNKYLSNAKRSSAWKALCPISPNVSYSENYCSLVSSPPPPPPSSTKVDREGE